MGKIVQTETFMILLQTKSDSWIRLSFQHDTFWVVIFNSDVNCFSQAIVTT